MKNITKILIFLLVLASCESPQSVEKESAETAIQKSEGDKIKVLNLGTFHMGFTSDANSVEYDEHSEKNKEEIHKIAEMLSSFEPTVIVVETVPKYNKELQEEYSRYKSNPDMNFSYPSEIELLAYELGRISQVSRLYGIDHKMDYDYPMIDSLAKALQEETYLDYMENANLFSNSSFSEANTLEKLRVIDQPNTLDFLVEVNADILTHVSTENNFEGADEAAKYYHRNLRMYSNLNQLPLTRQDRVFILMGASHTAFFRDFMSRSPKYEMVNTFEYLK